MRIDPSNTSLHGQLTNEFQNGASISRTYDALACPTGYRLIETAMKCRDSLSQRTHSLCALCELCGSQYLVAGAIMQNGGASRSPSPTPTTPSAAWSPSASPRTTATSSLMAFTEYPLLEGTKEWEKLK